MLVVAALGGNALLRPGDPLDDLAQKARVGEAAEALVEIARHADLVVTHGNGPQVGLLARQAESAGTPRSLDVLDAESEGMIGYWIEQELGNRLPDREIATLLTQVEVDPKDPAFATPTKPIGPARPDGTRRLVASPEPHHIVELRTIRLLVRLSVVVICAGGGGIPVVRDATGARHGVDAVIDKDLAAAVLATQLGADRLLLLTDVPAVYRDWPEPARDAIRHIRPSELVGMEFEPGTMGPKVEAARRFAAGTGNRAGIGALEDAGRILRGEAGTLIGT